MSRPDGPGMSDRWRDWRARVDLAEYETRWEHQAEAGADIHGEADLIERFLPDPGNGTVVDGGCGTGRIGVELARRGHTVIGVDNDTEMLALARAKAPAVTWLCGDLAEITLPHPVEAIALAGNVLIFVEPGAEAAVVANLARQLTPGGVFIAGHSLPAGPASVAEYDRWAAAAGLEPVHRFADWDANPYAGGDYAVFVDQKPSVPSTRSR